MLSIHLDHITKRFGQEIILSEFEYTFTQPSSTALLGINGSGKSTLLQLMAGFVMPGKGQVHYVLNGTTVEKDRQFEHISFCAPYLELIEEMTLEEFLTYHFSFKPSLRPVGDIISYLGLERAQHKFIHQFSSGMKQRVKLAQAVFANTPALLLDEPCTNLDAAGIALYQDMMREFTRDRLLVVASNDPIEYGVCDRHLSMELTKPSAV